jgi:hypothetical protein
MVIYFLEKRLRLKKKNIVGTNERIHKRYRAHRVINEE